MRSCHFVASKNILPKNTNSGIIIYFFIIIIFLLNIRNSCGYLTIKNQGSKRGVTNGALIISWLQNFEIKYEYSM